VASWLTTSRETTPCKWVTGVPWNTRWETRMGRTRVGVLSGYPAPTPSFFTAPAGANP